MWYCLQMFGRWNRLFLPFLYLLSSLSLSLCVFVLANCSVYSWARRKCKENKAIKWRKMPFCYDCRLLLVGCRVAGTSGVVCARESRIGIKEKREKLINFIIILMIDKQLNLYRIGTGTIRNWIQCLMFHAP